jgi:hypothetical protein
MTSRSSTAAPILPGLANLGAVPLDRPRLDAVLVGLCLLFAGGSIWFSATAGEQTVILLATLPVCLISTVVASLLAYGRSLPSCAGHILLGPCVVLIVVLSTAATNWPLRVSYAIHRPAFDQLAERVRAGEEVATPRQIGLFKIQRAEISHNGIICLWTGLDSKGYTGFVQCRPDHVTFNVWSIVRLDDRWQFISED